MSLVVENPLANSGDIRDMCLIPGLGRSPGGGHGLRKKRLLWLFQVFCVFIQIVKIFVLVL